MLEKSADARSRRIQPCADPLEFRIDVSLVPMMKLRLTLLAGCCPKVVPHEVMGMSSYTKNILIGLGGKEAIDLSHFIGAAYGMEKMMGKADNPLRRILNRAAQEFLGKLPLVTVAYFGGKYST